MYKRQVEVLFSTDTKDFCLADLVDDLSDGVAGTNIAGSGQEVDGGAGADSMVVGLDGESDFSQR